MEILGANRFIPKGFELGTRVSRIARFTPVFILLKALEVGKASARKRIHNWSCGQDNFASEDQRLWTE